MRFTWNDRVSRFPFNNKGNIGEWFSHGGLAGMLMDKKDKGSEPAPAPLPDPNAAAQTALDAQNKDRRTLLASGGRTDLTSGSGMLLGSDINSLNVGGS